MLVAGMHRRPIDAPGEKAVHWGQSTNKVDSGANTPLKSRARLLLPKTRYIHPLNCPILYRTLVGSLPPILGVEQPLADAGLPELERHPGPESPVQCGSRTLMAGQMPLGSAGREAPCSLRCRGAKCSSAPFVLGLLQGVVGVRGTNCYLRIWWNQKSIFVSTGRWSLVVSSSGKSPSRTTTSQVMFQSCAT